jgi:hypothetical protein
MLARYLIEDNNIEIVKFNNKLSSDVFMINSILKNALLNYKLYNIQKEEELHNRLTMVIISFYYFKYLFSS